MKPVTLFEQQDADLEHIASFWNEVSAEHWRDAAMAVIAPLDCDCETWKVAANAAECRIPVVLEKLDKLLESISEFCGLRGIEIVSKQVSGTNLDIIISPRERAVDVATYIEILNAEHNFLQSTRVDPWAIGERGRSIAISPAGVPGSEIRLHTAEYIIEYMSQVVGDQWRGGHASVHGFADFMRWRIKYVSKSRDRLIAKAIDSNIRENEETFKEEAPERYLKRVEKYLQNPDSPFISAEDYAWAVEQLHYAKCHFDGKELHIKVQLQRAPKEISIVPYDLGPNAERVKVRLGLDEGEKDVDVDAVKNLLVKLREVIEVTD